MEIKRFVNCLFIFIIVTSLYGCSGSPANQKNADDIDAPIIVEMITDLGTIVLQVSNKTPLHRDNLVKNVNSAYFDGLLFHRVIEGFGIQSGDFDTRESSPIETIGNGVFQPMIPAEINNTLFHKRGALNAARIKNPDRASSNSQFFIVQGKVQNDSTLARAENRINGWLAEYYFLHAPSNGALNDLINFAIDKEDWDALDVLYDSVHELAKNYHDFEKYRIPDAHREIYKTIGGSPHLDQNYTVFGEVIQGMNVMDSVAAVETDSLNRPLKDVRIRSMRIISNEHYQ